MPKRWTWAVDKPDDIAIQKHIGRFFRVRDTDGEYVVVAAEKIVGSFIYPTKFEIHAKDKIYLISMLDFFAQANEEYVSEEEIKLFDETSFDVVPNKKAGPLWRH